MTRRAPVSVRRIVSESELPHPRLPRYGMPVGIHFSTSDSIKQKPPGRIGHLGDFCIGQVANISIGQVTSSCFNARATASARLETPSLDKMLLTCALAVERVTTNRSAISGLLSPSTIKDSTWRSRRVNL